MRRPRFVPVLLAVLACGSAAPAQDTAKHFPAFRMEEVQTGLKVGWSVLVEDVNGDGKKDILVVAPTGVVWCESPTWKPHVMVAEGATKPNSMTISHVVPGGRTHFALGGGWKPFETKSGSSAVWLQPGKDVTAPWTATLVSEEPMIHRVRFADVLGEGEPQLVVAPMMGRDSTEAKNWTDGRPVRLLAYRIPKEPTKDRWVDPVVIDESLHVVHGLTPLERSDGKGVDLLTASYEGVHLLARDGKKWTKTLLTAGNQENPAGSRGTSEVKPGKLKDGRKFLATIEPWHGHQFVVYTEPAGPGKPWDRHVIDDQLKYGHTVSCADLDGDGNDEVVVGVMQNHADKPGARRGVRLYKATDAKGANWVRHVLDDGEFEVEDLTAVDLKGSGRLDIVVVGKQSGTVRIYCNEGTK